MGQLPAGAVVLVESVEHADADRVRRRARARLHHADDAVGRGHARDRRRAAGALPAHPRTQARGHLLCDDQPAERRQGDRAALRRAAGRRRAQFVELASASSRSRASNGCPRGRADRPRRRDRLALSRRRRARSASPPARRRRRSWSRRWSPPAAGATTWRSRRSSVTREETCASTCRARSAPDAALSDGGLHRCPRRRAARLHRRVRHRRGRIVQGHRRRRRELELSCCAPSSGTFILTLYEKRVAPDDLPFFIALMEHLAAHGIACPTPIKARDGDALRQLCGRPAALVTFLDGMWPRRIQPFHCAGARRRAGASCIVAGAIFAMRRPNNLSVAGWRQLFDACRGRADEVRRRASPRSSAGELDALERRWPQHLPGGVIHADLFPDNVFFRGERGLRPDRLLFRLHRLPRLRPRHLPQRLVLRERWQLQRHQGAAAAGELSRRARRSARTRSRRCRCWRAAAPCASC